MLKVLQSLKASGLELTSNEIKAAEVSIYKKKPFIHRLFALPLPFEETYVKRLYSKHSTLTTGIDSYDILIRSLDLPLTKDKDIEAALIFQAEPLLPYPIEEAILTYQIAKRDQESTTLTLFSVRKDLLKNHLEQWQQIKIEPEIVSCVQTALANFGHSYLKKDLPYLILHLNDKFMTCLLMKENKLISSYSQQEGLDLIHQAYKKIKGFTLPFNQIDFNQLSVDYYPELLDVIKRLQQNLTKMHYALSKDLKGDVIEGILITGEGLNLTHFDTILANKLNLPLLNCQVEADGISSKEKQRYAVSIGLALGALPEIKDVCNFRQKDLSYPHPWKRIKIPLATYFALILALTISFYFFGHYYLNYKEDKLKQEYVDLLAAMNKSYEHFETAFLTKNALAREKFNGEVVSVEHLKHDDLLERLQFLQKDLQATPDSFPLFANIPKVSDVLAWLSRHPLVIAKEENGELQPRLQLENFTYTMLKRPVQGKKQEKYQVKVELEFSSPKPKWAREFHDALIASNDLVDPKGEVKWSSNRGKYRTSFFLKDKTSYPNQ